MKLLTLAAACAALVTLSAAPALAGDSVTAKLQTPVAQKTKFIAGGAMFVCEGDACVASAPQSTTFASGTCKTIAAKVGPLTSFGGFKSLDEAKLADCNSVAVAGAAGAKIAKQ
jgi:hypothetical protein